MIPTRSATDYHQLASYNPQKDVRITVQQKLPAERRDLRTFYTAISAVFIVVHTLLPTAQPSILDDTDAPVSATTDRLAAAAAAVNSASTSAATSML